MKSDSSQAPRRGRAGGVTPEVKSVEPLALDHPAVIDAAQALKRSVRDPAPETTTLVGRSLVT